MHGLAHSITFNRIVAIDLGKFNSVVCLYDPATTLVASRMQMSAINNDVKGYWIGGYTGSSGSGEIDGIQYSDDTQVNPSATLTTTRYGHAGCQSGGYL